MIADRPTRVLLLHGLAGSPDVWEPLVAGLTGSLEVWAPELPWSSGGDRTWARDPDVTQWLHRALAAVPAGVDAVIAHSFAATALLVLLDEIEAPDPLAHLGLAGVLLVSPFYRAEPDEFDWAMITYYLDDFHHILEHGVQVRGRGALPAEVRAAMALHIRARVGPYGWMRFFDTYLRTPQVRTGRLTGRWVLVGGERDIAALPRDVAALERALPGASAHVLDGCGHFPMVERAEDLAVLVDGFLASLDDRHPVATPRIGAHAR